MQKIRGPLTGPLIYAVVGVACVLIWAMIAGWPGTMTAVSYDQERLDSAIPAPRPEKPIRFTFVPDHDGLSSIELVIVNFQPDDPAATGAAVLSLTDERGTLITSRRLTTSGTKHNATISLSFDPIKDSSQQTLTLTMIGNGANGLSLWGYSLNLWPDSQLSAGGDAQTLRAITRYGYQWHTTPAVLQNLLGRFWFPILAALLYITLPGAILLSFAKRDAWDPTVRLALSVGMGVAIWPLVWQWLTVLGLSLSGPILWGLIAIGWTIVIAQSIRTPRQPLSADFWLMLVALVLLFLLRLIAIRDMAFLPWVDSSRHALITAIMRDSGQFLTGYEPYLPISWTGYHYGLHTLSAGIALLVGDGVSLPDQLLPLMQLLSVGTTLTVYAGGVLLTGRKSVGWLAAFFLSLPFLFPAYYTTWGRLTQISGMLVLPLLVGLLAQPNRSKNFGKMATFGAILTAGLFLLHARVFFYFIPFGLVLTGYHLVRFALYRLPTTDHRPPNTIHRSHLSQLATIALAAGLLTLPRIWRLLNETTYTGLGVISDDGRPLLDFPVGYATAGWELWFWILAGLGIAAVLVGRLAQKQSNENSLVLPTTLLAGWLALLYLMTAGPSLASNWPILLPQSSVNSAYIAAFAAQAILIGIGVVRFAELANRTHRLAGLVVIALIGAGLTAGTLFGIKNQVTILNRLTVLGHQADLAAIEWIDENTGPNVKVANNSWLWLGSTWAGSDGAAWLTPMTGRLSGTPPIDHIYNSRLFGITSAYNDAAKDVQDWSDPATLDLLRQNRFTHIFTGVSDGAGGVDYDPAELLRNPGVRVVFTADGVYVFEILPP